MINISYWFLLGGDLYMAKSAKKVAKKKAPAKKTVKKMTKKAAPKKKK